MKFTPTRLEGVLLVESQAQSDERGWFARTFCAREFAERGLVAPVAQSSLSFNRQRRTLRGLHWQIAPHAETKLVRCVQGAIWDVIVDMRSGSETFGTWEAFELTAENCLGAYIPEGLAHGFLTMEPSSLVHYQISCEYAPRAARGLRWNDPQLAIPWPCLPEVISERDRLWPDWRTYENAQEGDLHACRR